MKSKLEKQLQLRQLQHQFFSKQVDQISKKRKKSKVAKQIPILSDEPLQLNLVAENKSSDGIPSEQISKKLRKIKNKFTYDETNLQEVNRNSFQEDANTNQLDTNNIVNVSMKNQNLDGTLNSNKNNNVQINKHTKNNNIVVDDNNLQIEFEKQVSQDLHESENSDEDQKQEWLKKQLASRNEGINLFGKPWWEAGNQNQQQQQIDKQNEENQFKKREIQDIIVDADQFENEVSGDQFFRQKSVEEIQQEVDSQREQFMDNWKLRRRWHQKLQQRRQMLL